MNRTGQSISKTLIDFWERSFSLWHSVFLVYGTENHTRSSSPHCSEHIDYIFRWRWSYKRCRLSIASHFGHEQIKHFCCQWAPPEGIVAYHSHTRYRHFTRQKNILSAITVFAIFLNQDQCSGSKFGCPWHKFNGEFEYGRVSVVRAKGHTARILGFKPQLAILSSYRKCDCIFGIYAEYFGHMFVWYRRDKMWYLWMKYVREFDTFAKPWLRLFRVGPYNSV